MEEKGKKGRMDYTLLLIVVLLVVIGLVILYSTSAYNGQVKFHDSFYYLKKQAFATVLGIVLMLFVAGMDYHIWQRLAVFGYLAAVALSVAVMLFGREINGSKRWLALGPFSFQPSEFAKICVILSLALSVVKVQRDGKDSISKPLQLLKCLLVVIVPVLLIIKQPDYGTAIAFCIRTAMILITAGLNKKYIIGAIILAVIALPLLYFFVLPSHAKTRIDVFLNPNLDPRGSGYNVLQSKLAIGSGKLFGMGIKNGSQTQLGYLYPQTTDFIYSAIGEEMGFIIAALVIVLYLILITKAIYVAKTAKDDLGSYIAAGIAGIFLFHMVENIGMTMGLLPITGVPLPFVSYGGSSLLTNLMMIGLLLDISGRRQKAIFID